MRETIVTIVTGVLVGLSTYYFEEHAFQEKQERFDNSHQIAATILIEYYESKLNASCPCNN